MALGSQGLAATPAKLGFDNLGGAGSSGSIFLPDRWDAATAEAFFFLAENDRSSGRPSAAAGLGCGRSINSVNSGKYYVEDARSATSILMTQYSLGFGRASSFLNSGEPGVTAGSMAYRTALSGVISLDGSIVDSAPPVYDAGTDIGMAIDFDAQLAWYHFNGTYVGGGTQDPNTGQGGFDFSSMAGSGPFVLWAGGDFWAALLANESRTLNYGHVPAVYDVPIGFTLGWPA